MCTTCGCDTIDQGQNHKHEHPGRAETQHHHRHSRSDDTAHHHSVGELAPEPIGRSVRFEHDLLAKNDERARLNRLWFDEQALKS